jgi:cell wall-associated NlpC family hydrolase
VSASSRIPAAVAAAASFPVLLIVVIMAPVMMQGGSSGSGGAGGALGGAASALACALPGLQVGDPIPGVGGKLAADQFANGQEVYAVAYAQTGSDQAATDALTGALQASGLHLSPVGAPADAVGLFALRPSRGWGSPDQLRDPGYATAQFVASLTNLPDWSKLSAPAAAAAALRTGPPGDYAPYAAAAARLTSAFDTMANACARDDALPSNLPIADVGLPKDFALPADTPAPVATAIAFALSKVGMWYQWGGVGNPSYDCSGLLQMAYKAGGVSISRTTFDQVNDGTPVYSLSALHPGDLLFIAGSDGSASSPGHVGMYVGEGYLVQAPHTGAKITVSTLASWSSGIVAMRNIVAWPASAR